MITKLFFDKELDTYYQSDGGINSLENLNRLNILIGANNSGKSRFLRRLFSERNFKLELTEFDSNKISKIFSEILQELDQKLTDLGYEDVSSQNIPGLKQSLNKHINDLNQIEMQNVSKIAADLNTFWSWLKNFTVTGASHKAHIISISGGYDKPTNAFKEIFDKYSPSVSELIPETFDYASDRVYIPILRGLRPTQFHNEHKFNEVEDNYCKRTLRDYFRSTSVKEHEIFTGLRLYDDTRKMLLGKRDERNRIRNFETFLSKTFFDSQELTLIPNIEDDSLHISIGAEEWPIYNLGDGIQSIIILLYPLFFNQGKKMLVFIEEPENSMHPGLQRLFIETIMQDRFSNYQYYITTHSNHFLDITLDINGISIYSFNKLQTESEVGSVYKIENPSNDNTNILDLIGVRNSSVFLSNCTIWVEGITDRLYIKKYLEIYQNHIHPIDEKNKFREDYNFSFIEYGGSNMTHWAFDNETALEKIKANRISTKIFFIADKDSTETNPTSKKAMRLKRLKNVLGDNLQIINGREIENVLMPLTLINTIKKLEKDNSPNIMYDETCINKQNYLNEPLGKFIVASFQNLKRKYDSESGTISCKLDFCKAAINNIQTIEDLSPEALILIKDVYNFIVAANKN